jgi:hypothetical protein
MTIMEHVNGTQQRGRAVRPLPEHTFKDSGITIKIRKVGPTTQQRLAQQIMKEQPEPVVPVIDTELGPEPNAADPTYLAAKAAWDRATSTALNERLLLIAALECEVTIDDTAWADIARKQRHLQLIGIPHADNPELTAEENEKVFYILNVAAATPEDLGEFGAAVMHRSIPTEDAVQAQIATFPDSIQGA